MITRTTTRTKSPIPKNTLHTNLFEDFHNFKPAQTDLLIHLA